MADWEQAISPLIAHPGITPSANGTPLALQFDVQEPALHFSYTGRRDPLRSSPARGTPRHHGRKGQVDPRRRLLEHTELPELPARMQRAHVEWMQEFLASHTAVANRQHSAPDSGWD